MGTKTIQGNLHVTGSITSDDSIGAKIYQHNILITGTYNEKNLKCTFTLLSHDSTALTRLPLIKFFKNGQSVSVCGYTEDIGTIIQLKRESLSNIYFVGAISDDVIKFDSTSASNITDTVMEVS